MHGTHTVGCSNAKYSLGDLFYCVTECVAQAIVS